MNQFLRFNIHPFGLEQCKRFLIYQLDQRLEPEKCLGRKAAIHRRRKRPMTTDLKRDPLASYQKTQFSPK